MTEPGGEGTSPPGFEELPGQAQSQIQALLGLLETDPEAPTTVADRATAMQVHVAEHQPREAVGDVDLHRRRPVGDRRGRPRVVLQQREQDLDPALCRGRELFEARVQLVASTSGATTTRRSGSSPSL